MFAENASAIEDIIPKLFALITLIVYTYSWGNFFFIKITSFASFTGVLWFLAIVFDNVNSLKLILLKAILVLFLEITVQFSFYI